MRASETGGCNRASETILCRMHQADFLSGAATAQGVRLQGCPPCVVLPFSSIPSSCPDDIRAAPNSADPRLDYIMEFQNNIDFAASRFDSTRPIGNQYVGCLEILTTERTSIQHKWLTV